MGVGNADAVIVVTTPACPGCGTESTRILPYRKYREWKIGGLIQDVFPEMSIAERETLKTGWHGKCWATMFGGLDEEEDDAT